MQQRYKNISKYKTHAHTFFNFFSTRRRFADLRQRHRARSALCHAEQGAVREGGVREVREFREFKEIRDFREFREFKRGRP